MKHHQSNNLATRHRRNERIASLSCSASAVPVFNRYARLTFGKHRGKEWIEAPTDYLRWLAQQGGDSGHFARLELQARGVNMGQQEGDLK